MPSDMATKSSIMLHCTSANLSEINPNEQSCGEQMFFNTSFNMKGTVLDAMSEKLNV